MPNVAESAYLFNDNYFYSSVAYNLWYRDLVYLCGSILLIYFFMYRKLTGTEISVHADITSKTLLYKSKIR